MPSRYKAKLVKSGPHKGKYKYTRTHYAASVESVPLKSRKKTKSRRTGVKSKKLSDFKFRKKDLQKFGSRENWERGMRGGLKWLAARRNKTPQSLWSTTAEQRFSYY